MAAPRRLVVLAAAAAAGSACGYPRPADVDPDPPDAAEPPPTRHRYVVDSMQIPTSNAQAQALGYDFDGDGTPDNRFGAAIATLAALTNQGDRVQGAHDAAIDRGEILVLAALEVDGQAGSLATFRGASPEPAPCLDPGQLATCRRHLGGDGRFAVDPAPGTGARVAGELVDGTFRGGPGTLLVQLASLDGSVLTVELAMAFAELSQVSDTGFAAGRLAGGLSAADVDTYLVGGLHDEVEATIAADCTGLPPDCGCVEDSQGKTILEFYDTDGDCRVSHDEIRNASLIQSLLALDLDTNGDGIMDALSLGIGITGVAASFELP
jgi:hypothetical protein